MTGAGTYPGGRKFAFTILDDTDDSTLENVRPVYDRLRDYGFRTTKTVWANDCPQGSRLFHAADTLQRPDYLAYVHELIDAGFELASHGATMESSSRHDTQRALDFLEAEFGASPRLHVNHAFNRENLYWGAKRFQTAPLQWLLAKLRNNTGQFEGECKGSEYFWGDICQEHIQYVRNFTFSQLNMLAVNAKMPYRVDSTPYVRGWFSTTDAPDAGTFSQRITREALEKLEEDAGICIVSTHLGKGYMRDGELAPEVASTLEYLAERPGWFVPVSEILDYQANAGAGGRLSTRERIYLELRYLLDQLCIRLGVR